MVLKPDVVRSCSRGCEMAPLLVFDGDKGGVGKSFLARIATYLVSSVGKGWIGLDLDTRNAHLFRFHQENDVTRFNWTEPQAWDQLYGQVMQADASKVLLVDLPAQAGQVLLREYPRLSATAGYLGRPLLRFWCLSRSFDSVNLLSQSLSAVPAADTFAVKNFREAEPEGFDLWESSKTRQALLAGGGTELALPLLPGGVSNAIEAADLSFSEARSRLREPWFLYDVENYLARIDAEFAPVARRLA